MSLTKGYYVVLWLTLLVLAACNQTNVSEERLEPQVLPLNLVVNSVNDWPDANPGNGICASWIGNCTLRAAIEETNAWPSADKITLPGTMYELTSGRLEITDNVVIMGQQSSYSYPWTTIDGQNNDLIFYINGSAYAGTKRLRVELHYLTIRNGYTSADGAGIFNSGAQVLVHKSLITGNVAFSEGAGIANFSGGILELRYSTVSNNGNMLNHEPGRGGGIYNSGSSYLLVVKSTINSNQANRYGGIANYGTVQMVSSTLSYNQSRIDTGGLLNTGLAALSNVTLAFNEGTVEADETDHMSAGGLHNIGTLHMKNTLLSNNQNHFSSTQDCLGTINSLGYNLVHQATDCTLVGDLTGNQLNIDPHLKNLGLNGAKTQTHAIDTNSPAYNAGNPAVPNGVGAACEATDQRTKARGFGPAGRCDMGAYEYQGAPSGGFTP